MVTVFFSSKYFFSRYLYIRSFGNNVSFRMGFPRRRSPSFVSAPPPSVLAAPTPFLCGPFLTAEGWVDVRSPICGKVPLGTSTLFPVFLFLFPTPGFFISCFSLSPHHHHPHLLSLLFPPPLPPLAPPYLRDKTGSAVVK